MCSSSALASDASNNNALSGLVTPKTRLHVSDRSEHESNLGTDSGSVKVNRKDAEDRSTSDFTSSLPLLSKCASKFEPKKAVALHTRFREDKDGRHEHSIDSARRLGKWLSMRRHLKEQQVLHVTSNWIRGLRKEREEFVERQSLANPAQTLTQKYGRVGYVLGYGTFGTVRIAYKKTALGPENEQLYAVKELKQNPGESVKKYHKRLTSEFCISSSLCHQNIVTTLDLLQDAKGVYCEVMEYCSGGDLHAVILAAGELEEKEADCFFKQLMRGVEYMHEMGVAHRDLKPENILLTQRGTIKITDFGNTECFRTAWETDAHLSVVVCGSTPYIAPEEYVHKEFDPRAVDVWACGVIYMAMRTGQYLWRVARTEKDESFKKYVEDRKTDAGYGPIEGLRRRVCRNVIYSTLDPKPTRRLTAHQVLSSTWVELIKVCVSEHY